MTAFFSMGGYAVFVWPAYAVSFGGLAAMVVLTLRAQARARQRQAHLKNRIQERD
jgi:heme exporter protein CcmD